MGESRVSCHGTDQARLEINEALGHNCQWLGTCNGGSRNEFEVTSKSKWIETRLAVQEHLANFQRYIHNPAIIIQDNTSGIPMKCQAQITCKSTAGSWHELTEVADSDNHTAPKIKSIKNIKKQSPAVGRPLCGQWNEVMFCAKLTWWCSTWGNFNMFIHFQYFQCSGAKTLSRKACDVSAQPRVRRPKCCRIKWNPFPNSLLMSGALDLGLPRIHVIADPSWPVTLGSVGICWAWFTSCYVICSQNAADVDWNHHGPGCWRLSRRTCFGDGQSGQPKHPAAWELADCTAPHGLFVSALLPILIMSYPPVLKTLKGPLATSAFTIDLLKGESSHLGPKCPSLWSMAIPTSVLHKQSFIKSRSRIFKNGLANSICIPLALLHL